VIQVVSDFIDADAEFDLLCRIVERSGRPLSFSLAQHAKAPDRYRHLLDRLSEATARGLPMKAQVCGRPVGLLMGLELTLHPFVGHPSYREIRDLPLAARVQRLHDPAFRARLFAEQSTTERGFIRHMPRFWPTLFLMEGEPDYEQPSARSVSVRALERGTSPEEVALDHLLSQGGRGLLYLPFLNYAEFSLDACREMLAHADTVVGLSDGGAHVGMICDGSLPTSNLVHWTRDRTRGPKLPLELMIKMQTRDTAEAVGLRDRGLVAVGQRADLNVIDYEKLALRLPEVTHDLPAGGRRLMQRADGYAATIVAGTVTYRDGQATGALPGRLVRGARG
jgi:N-acyl-D-aspartate/D-glutamate deacylase